MAMYGIVGGGAHPDKVITAGLSDIFGDDSDNTLLVVCRKGATASEKIVYDWVLDNELNYTCFYSEDAPKVLLESAQYLSRGDNPDLAVVNELARDKGTLLILWDDDNVERMNQLVTMAHDLGVSVKELSNGLTPIAVVDTPVAETVTERVEKIPTNEVEIEPLSEDELKSLSVGLLRKAAANQGIENTASMSKDALVSAIQTPEESKEHSKQVMMVWYENGDLQIEAFPYSALDVIQDALGRG